MVAAERRWVVEWRMRVRTRLEGPREVTLVAYARTAAGAKAIAMDVQTRAVDHETRLRIDGSGRSDRRPPIVADPNAIDGWNTDTAPLPERFWRSRWVEAERSAHARTLIGVDFEEAARRAVHARLIDDGGAATLLDAVEQAFEAYAVANRV